MNTKQQHGGGLGANARVLSLFFELLGSRRGCTRAQLRRAIGYVDEDDRHLVNTVLARDLDVLEDLGVRVESVTVRGEERLRIADSSFPAEVAHLSAEQIELVRLALAAWGQRDRDAEDIIASKLAPVSAAPAGVVAPLNVGLAGAEHVVTILDAIADRVPVTFTYTSRNGRAQRGVEPWEILVNGRAAYLWGWDLDREDTRLFRLSRIEGAVETLGEPGDAAPMPAHSFIDPFAANVISPQLHVRADHVDDAADWIEHWIFDGADDEWDEDECEDDEWEDDEASDDTGDDTSPSYTEVAGVDDPSPADVNDILSTVVFSAVGRDASPAVWESLLLAHPQWWEPAPEDDLHAELIARARAALDLVRRSRTGGDGEGTGPDCPAEAAHGDTPTTVGPATHVASAGEGEIRA